MEWNYKIEEKERIKSTKKSKAGSGWGEEKVKGEYVLAEIPKYNMAFAV